MSEIKTALERFQAYCASKGIPEKSSLAHIHKIDQFEEHERKELRAAYEALQKENAELKATISNLTKAYERESNDCLKALEERDYWYEKTDSLADKISEVFDVPIGEHSNVNCPFDEANKILDGEYVTKFDKESAAQAKRIEELEAATEHLGLTPQQAADGLARHKAQVAEIESLRKQVEALEQSQLNEVINLRTRNAQLQAKMDQFAEVLKRHHQIAPFDLVNRLVTILLSAPEYQEPTKDEQC